MMKTVYSLLMLVAASQAVDWANIRPDIRFRIPINGIPLETTNSRIVGGALATEGQFPYQVGVFMDSSWFCGGSLISDSVILTAGHCVDGYSRWDVHCGALNIRDEQEPGRVIVNTNDAKAHEDYNAFFLTSDIAIIKLGQSVSGPNIKTVRLPSRSMSNDLFVGETCRVSGWGKVSDSVPYINDDLKFVDVDIISNDECAAYYGTGTVKDSTICISTNGGTVSTCNGDSGGPMVITEADGEVTEIAVVSFVASLGCESGAPSGFARVTSFLDWIESNAGVSIRP